MFRQEVSVPCPGQQWLPGDEEEEPRGAGEGDERRRRDERARSASQWGSVIVGSLTLKLIFAFCLPNSWLLTFQYLVFWHLNLFTSIIFSLHLDAQNCFLFTFTKIYLQNLSFLSLFLFLLQGSQSPTALSRALSCLSAAPRQSRPPAPSSLCTWPQAPGMISSPWGGRATWRPARTAAAGPSGASQALRQRNCLYLVCFSFCFWFCFAASHKDVLLQGDHVGQWNGELGNLPSVLAGGGLCAATVQWRSVHALCHQIVLFFSLAGCAVYSSCAITATMRPHEVSNLDTLSNLDLR